MQPLPLRAATGTSVIQRNTTWKWEGGRWMPSNTDGEATPRPDRDGLYAGEYVVTEKPVAAPVVVVEERDAAWKAETRKPLYAEAFGETVNPGKLHSEQAILNPLTGHHRPNEEHKTKQRWAARLAKIQAGTASLELELNAWPCNGHGDPGCHSLLQEFSRSEGATVIVKVVGDSGGYETGHKGNPGWVAGATKITYTRGVVTYSK